MQLCYYYDAYVVSLTCAFLPILNKVQQAYRFITCYTLPNNVIDVQVSDTT